MLTTEAVALQRSWFADIAEANPGARQQVLGLALVQPAAHARTPAHEAHQLMTAPQQRRCRGLADGAGGTEHEDALTGSRHVERPAAQRGILKGSMACTQGWPKRCSDRLSCTVSRPSSRSRSRERL